MQIDIWGELIRKGSDNDSLQYAGAQPQFLYGLKNYYKYFGVKVKYEWMHELNFEAGFRNNFTRNEVTDGLFDSNRVNEFSLSVYYGI